MLTRTSTPSLPSPPGLAHLTLSICKGDSDNSQAPGQHSTSSSEQMHDHRSLRQQLIYRVLLKSSPLRVTLPNRQRPMSLVLSTVHGISKPQVRNSHPPSGDHQPLVRTEKVEQRRNSRAALPGEVPGDTRPAHRPSLPLHRATGLMFPKSGSAEEQQTSHLLSTHLTSPDHSHRGR